MKKCIRWIIGLLIIGVGTQHLCGSGHEMSWKHEIERFTPDGRLIIKDSGFYGVYLRKLPLVKIWNRWKVLDFLREKLGQTTHEIMCCYDHGMPIYYTRNHDEADQLKSFLENIGCTVDIIELQFHVQFP